MKWQDCSKTSLVLIAFIAAFVISAGQAKADFTFGKPTNLGPVINSPNDEYEPDISFDGLSLFFSSNRPGGYGDMDLWITTRATKEDEWSPPVNLGPNVNTSAAEHASSISSDGLSLYVASERPGGSGNTDLWVTKRATTTEPWGQPINLGSFVNSSAHDTCPSISVDGLELFFGDDPFPPYRPGGCGNADVWVTTRASVSDAWATPTNLGPNVNSSEWDCGPSICADGLSLFFQSWRSGGLGDWDIYLTRRATKNESWSKAVNLGPSINSPDKESNPEISADGSTLYFCSNRNGGIGGPDLWQVPIIPIVDFNGDEIVDIKDLLILIEHWGQNEPLVDISPPPFGDGKVDENDLEVLMSYWGQEFPNFNLLAYWKLDEAEGNIVHDSSFGANDATINGEPVWQPNGGKVKGSLQLDGIDDYVSTPFVLNPAAGAFSVFAWVKGGAPGQVIISQTGGANWLLADPSGGKLMTELKGIGRNASALMSQTIITDGNWHRVGLTWNGSIRILYVDDVEVAKDTQADLAGSQVGLYIGAGRNLVPGSFWSGLIDDVRIYNRAVTP